MSDDGSSDGSSDFAKPSDGAPGDQARDSKPTPDGGCVALKRTAGPMLLGYAESGSLFGGLAATSTHIAAVWEEVTYDSAIARIAITKPDGQIVVKARTFDECPYSPSPAVAAIGDDFAVLYLRNSQNPVLVYQRIDSAGVTKKTTELATNPGGYMSAPAIVSGPAGIFIAYTRHTADKKGDTFVAKVDTDGAMAAPFAPVTTADESWHPALVATNDGVFAAWSESRGDCWAVVAARLDGSLQQVSPPGAVTVADDEKGCYQRPSLDQLGDDLLVCAERAVADADTAIVCRLMNKDGTLADESVTSLVGLSSRRPRVVAGGGQYALFWTAKTTGLEEVHVRLFSSAGVPLGEQRVSEDGVRSFYPAAIWTGDSFLAAWYRYVPITVYYGAFRLACDD